MRHKHLFVRRSGSSVLDPKSSTLPQQLSVHLYISQRRRRVHERERLQKEVEARPSGLDEPATDEPRQGLTDGRDICAARIRLEKLSRGIEEQSFGICRSRLVRGFDAWHANATHRTPVEVVASFNSMYRLLVFPPRPLDNEERGGASRGGSVVLETSTKRDQGELGRGEEPAQKNEVRFNKRKRVRASKKRKNSKDSKAEKEGDVKRVTAVLSRWRTERGETSNDHPCLKKFSASFLTRKGHEMLLSEVGRIACISCGLMRRPSLTKTLRELHTNENNIYDKIRTFRCPKCAWRAQRLAARHTFKRFPGRKLQRRIEGKVEEEMASRTRGVVDPAKKVSEVKKVISKLVLSANQPFDPKKSYGGGLLVPMFGFD